VGGRLQTLKKQIPRCAKNDNPLVHAGDWKCRFLDSNAPCGRKGGVRVSGAFSLGMTSAPGLSKIENYKLQFTDYKSPRLALGG
jgi:hypothetical protein